MKTPANPAEAHLWQQNRKYKRWILALVIVNTLFFTLLIKGRPLPETFLAACLANVIAYPVAGFVLGTIGALLPYRNLPYRKKYLRASLLAILAIQALVLFGLLMIFLMTLVGWY